MPRRICGNLRPNIGESIFTSLHGVTRTRFITQEQVAERRDADCCAKSPNIVATPAPGFQETSSARYNGALRAITCRPSYVGLQAKITYIDGVRFEASARGHTIVCDQPRENAGTDAGMAPPELLLASLGSCAAYYAVEYLRARNLSTTGLTIAVTAEKAQQPPRLTNFTIMLNIPELAEQRQRDGVLRAVKVCLVHNTLIHSPTIKVEIGGKNLSSKEIETARHT